MRFAKTVKCNVNTIPRQLLFDKEYHVYGETEDGFAVRDEIGYITSYRKYMFDVIEWEDDEN